MMASSSAAEAEAQPPSTMSSIQAKTSSTNSNEDYNNRYIVTRNGILLPWTQIHQQYKQVDISMPDVNSGSSNNVEQIINTNQLLDLDAPTLLQLLPRGAYTTCRTVRGGTHIYQLDYHVRRLALSAQSILESIAGGNASNGNNNDNDSDKLPTPAKEGRRASLSKSNHPQQHHRTPDKDEIYGMNIIDEAWERETALSCVRSSLDEFCTRYQINNGRAETDGESTSHHGDIEFRIVLLATWEKRDDTESSELPSRTKYQKQSFQSVLYCHVGILPQSSSNNINDQSMQQKHIQVLIHGHGRENALAKDSKWVIDRKKLLTKKPSIMEPVSTSSESEYESTTPSSSSYEEIILINDNGELLEGTQTNFYVVMNESIITANEGILYGSVRDSVLRVCEAHDIEVELRPPTLDDLRQASGVFITSTSRLVMPVHEVVLGDLLSFSVDKKENGDGKSQDVLPPSYCYPNCLITENIRKWVLEDVETRSTLVYVN